MGTKRRKHSKRALYPEKEPPRKPITGWRLWLFRIVTITIIPTLFFLLLEMSLRIVGYGYPPEAIVKGKSQGKDVCRDNVKFGWRFSRRTSHEISRSLFSLRASRPIPIEFLYSALPPPTANQMMHFVLEGFCRRC